MANGSVSNSPTLKAFMEGLTGKEKKKIILGRIGSHRLASIVPPHGQDQNKLTELILPELVLWQSLCTTIRKTRYRIKKALCKYEVKLRESGDGDSFVQLAHYMKKNSPYFIAQSSLIDACNAAREMLEDIFKGAGLYDPSKPIRKSITYVSSDFVNFSKAMDLVGQCRTYAAVSDKDSTYRKYLKTLKGLKTARDMVSGGNKNTRAARNKKIKKNYELLRTKHKDWTKNRIYIAMQKQDKELSRSTIRRALEN